MAKGSNHINGDVCNRTNGINATVSAATSISAIVFISSAAVSERTSGCRSLTCYQSNKGRINTDQYSSETGARLTSAGRINCNGFPYISHKLIKYSAVAITVSVPSVTKSIGHSTVSFQNVLGFTILLHIMTIIYIMFLFVFYYLGNSEEFPPM